jgi:Galactose oxidase, central domain/Kelch motif
VPGRREFVRAATAAAVALIVAACSTVSGPASWTPPASPPAGWSNAESMPAPRGGDLAVPLADGRVLLVGGRDEIGGLLGDALLYDPSDDAWTVAASPPTEIYLTSAVLLEGGTVLAVGNTGTGGPRTELYDPATGAWTEAAGPTAANGAALVALADGRALQCGGFDVRGEATPNAELFDLVELRWTATTSMTEARSGAAAARLADGRVLVIGGSGNGPLPNALNSAELFDPEAGQWAAAALMQARHGAPSAALLADGRVLVDSGISMTPDGYGWRTSPAELYDPVTNGWTIAGDDLSTGIQAPALTMSASQVLFVGLGGSSELFDVPSGRATAVPSPYGLTDGNVFGAAVAPLGDGRVLLAGGTLMRSGGHGLIVGVSIDSESIAATFVYDCRCASPR